MSLPNGYKRLEYIQSSGKQWIDTGFKPNQDTRVVMNCYVISFNSCDMFLFGARVSAGNTAFYVVADDTNTKWFISYGSDVQNPVGTCTGHHSIDMNKNSVSIDDAITTLSASTFQSASNLLLFATNSAGSADSQRGTMNLYSCQIYDNGTLVRDYIPCQTTAGEIGLLDDVNSVFYGNAGTGTFTAGPVVAIAADSSEVTELEYIESSGAQYVNSVFQPNQNTRLICEFELLESNVLSSVFGARIAYKNDAFVLWGGGDSARTYFQDDFADESDATLDSPAGKYNIDKNKNVTNVNSKTHSFTSATFQSNYSLYICAVNTAGTATFGTGGLRIFILKIYDNGTLIRDYMAAKLSDGTVGLYDKLNGLLYINMGTGSFTAGPEVKKAPQAPTGFSASPLTNTTVQLSWSASDGATGYKLYKNGDLLATLTDTSYTDTVQVFSGTLYAVTAYNDDGESTAAELTYCSIPENPILYLVTDRTGPDVAYAKELSEKGLGGMSDAEKAEWLSGLKGSYNASDLNRVGSAVDYVAGRLQSFGNAVEVYPKKDWATKDVPTVSLMKRYLNDLAALRAALAVLPTTPEVPPDMGGLTYAEANDIEKILIDIDLLITNMTSAWFYGGDIYSGEV